MLICFLQYAFTHVIAWHDVQLDSVQWDYVVRYNDHVSTTSSQRNLLSKSTLSHGKLTNRRGKRYAYYRSPLSETIHVWGNSLLMMMIAFVTLNSSLVPLIKGLCSTNPWGFEFSGIRRNRTDDLGIKSPSLWPTEPHLYVGSNNIPSYFMSDNTFRFIFLLPYNWGRKRSANHLLKQYMSAGDNVKRDGWRDMHEYVTWGSYTCCSMSQYVDVL